MTVSKEEFMTTTEFANRYNKSRPVDENFMPLEPSFVKLLCEQGKIEHSTLPARDGRKKDIYVIPEHELETVDVILNGDKAVKDEPGGVMEVKEVAEFLGRSTGNVWALAREGKLKARKIHNPHGGLDKYEFDEDDVLKFAEEHPKRHYTKRAEPKKDITVPVMSKQIVRNPLSDKINELNTTVENLQATIKKLVFENADLKDRIQNNASKAADKLKELNTTIKNLQGANSILISENADLKDQLDNASKTSDDKDIFEAYRRGFKDGFEMGGNK